MALFLFVTAVLAVIVGVVLISRSTNSEEERGGGLIAICIGLVVAALCCLVIIPAGGVGVPVVFGKVLYAPINEGLHMRSPWGPGTVDEVYLITELQER